MAIDLGRTTSSHDVINVPAPGGLVPSEESGCPPGEFCIGQKWCTIFGCVCIGICSSSSIGNGDILDLPFIPVPGNGGPTPPPPTGPGPLPPALPPVGQAPQLGTCPPRPGAIAAVACPAGCHPNKSDYFLRSGAFIGKGTRCVRNRRRNPLNPRALDRALSRLGSAQNAVERLGFTKKIRRRKRAARAKVC